jgi:hypothetical protein
MHGNATQRNGVFARMVSGGVSMNEAFAIQGFSQTNSLLCIIEG